MSKYDKTHCFCWQRTSYTARASIITFTGVTRTYTPFKEMNARATRGRTRALLLKLAHACPHPGLKREGKKNIIFILRFFCGFPVPKGSQHCYILVLTCPELSVFAIAHACTSRRCVVHTS